MMKITIAFQSGEEKEAEITAAMIRHLLGKVKVRKVDKHKPFRHVYITKEYPATGTAPKNP